MQVYIKRLYFFLFALHLHGYSISLPTTAVTYTLSSGRFGDNLVAYLHAKWISYKYNIPLLYKTFEYSDQLKLHDVEVQFRDGYEKQYNAIIDLKSCQFVNSWKNRDTLYIIPYFPESFDDFRQLEPGKNMGNVSRFRSVNYPHFAVDWGDAHFRELIKKLIVPRNKLSLIVPPEDCISIALHVRKGSDKDHTLLTDTQDGHYNATYSYFDVNYPLKFVPDSYFIEQLNFLANHFKNEKLYVFIFTDHPNPNVLAEKYKKEINNENIVFDYRLISNAHNSTVLEDFFSILNFDCFIRGGSNFSIVAAKLGNFKVEISPEHYHWQERKLIIDKVCITLRMKQ